MANDRGRSGEFGSDPSEGTSHPIGKGAGALAGAVAGGAVASSAGPIGTVGGALIGGIAGWLEGKTIAEGLNPDEQINHWGKTYKNRPYFKNGRSWTDYEPAYKYGMYSYDADREYEDVEEELERDWDRVRGDSRLTWAEANEASRDAWNKIHSDEK